MIIEDFLKNRPFKKIFVNQFCGLGDILFIEPIYKYLHSLGLEVIAPVQDNNIWIQDYIPYVKFIKWSDTVVDLENFQFTYLDDDTFYYPMRFSDQKFRGLKPHDPSAVRYWMTDKYRLIGLNPDQWKTLSFTRKPDKEKELYDLLINKYNTEDYIFCNKTYQNSLNLNVGDRINSIIPTNETIIELQILEGYSMLDWGYVIEKAKKVYTVSTSLIYYIQSLYQENKEYHIFPRLPDETRLISVEEFLPAYWSKHEF